MSGSRVKVSSGSYSPSKCARAVPLFFFISKTFGADYIDAVSMNSLIIAINPRLARLPANEEADHALTIPALRVLEKLFQDVAAILAALQLDDTAHAFARGIHRAHRRCLRVLVSAPCRRCSRSAALLFTLVMDFRDEDACRYLWGPRWRAFGATW